MSGAYLTSLQIVVTSADPAAVGVTGVYDVTLETRCLLADAGALGLALFRRAVPAAFEHACTVTARAGDILLTPNSDPIYVPITGHVARREA